MRQCVTESITGKFSAGFDEIPQYIVKQCILTQEETFSSYFECFFYNRHFSRQVENSYSKTFL
jgi:hypothetical protein